MASVVNTITGNESFRNKLINGNFDIWQRGTTPVGSTTYLADRWISTAGTESYSQGTTTPPAGSKYYGIVTRTTATTSSLGLTQRIESANTYGLSGTTVTLSFYIRQTAGTLIQVGYRISYAGAVDNFTSPVQVGSEVLVTTASASWQKVTTSFTVTSNMATNGFQIVIGNASVTGPVTLNIAQVQLEVGTTATAFEQRPIGMELNLCRRYYIRDTNMYLIMPTIQQGATNYNNGVYTFNVPMRATPAVGGTGWTLVGHHTSTPAITAYASCAVFTYSGTDYRSGGGLLSTSYIEASAEL